MSDRPATTADLRAAGGVLWRDANDGREVAVVHRPRYDDWSLPKGKLLAGESWAEGALREVLEETGCEAALGPELVTVTYPHSGRRKVVRYWALRCLAGGFVPGDEVDALRWLPVPAARALLSYDRDRAVLDAFEAVPWDP